MSTEGLFSASYATADAPASLLFALHKRMRVIWFCTALIFAVLAALATSLFAQQNVGIGTTTPDASSILDLTSTTKGFLVPRMSTTLRNGIPSPARSLLIYDLSYNAFWYFDGTNWVPFSNGWGLTGNAGTVDGVNFLGTTDNVPFTIRVNNLQAVRIEPKTNSPNIIMGYQGNSATSGIYGSNIAGGGVLGSANQITNNYDFVGGGVANVAGDGGGSSGSANFASVVGGSGNSATGLASSVLGGETHIAAGQYSSILGGEGDLTYAFSQSVVGQFNDPVPSAPYACVSNTFQYPAFIVGGGTGLTTRYNSMIVDFKGVLCLGEDGSNSTFSAVPQLKITGSTSGYVGFKAAAVTTSHSYVMPAAQGSANTILTNDGSGNLSWSNSGSTGSRHFAVTTISSFSSSTNNLALDQSKSVFRISSSSVLNLTGLADTSDGREVLLTNIGTNSISITNQDASSTAEYRIITGIGSNEALKPDKTLALYYDGTTKRWRGISITN
jgi:hypothetical protein